MRDCHRDQQTELQELATIIGELRTIPKSTPIIVEGVKDVESLKNLNIRDNVIHLNQGKSLIDFCNDLSLEYRKVVIMTDWDSKGETLCNLLQDNLKACDISYDTHMRQKLALVLRKEVKDIQGIYSFLSRNHPGILETILSE